MAYLLMGWLLLQGADFALDLIEAPNWVIQTLAVIAAIGLPVVLFIAWAFELTPEGIKREEEVDREASTTSRTGRKLDRAIIVFLVLVIAVFIGERVYRGGGAATAVDAPAVARDDAALTIAVLPLVNMSANPDLSLIHI